MTGFFVCVDGPNGVGKTTAVAGVVEMLFRLGLKVEGTKEPTETPLGQLVRRLDGRFRSEEAYACLVAADRREHIFAIDDRLRDGAVVVSDRYIPSSLVLNVARGVTEEFILRLHEGMRRPELTVILTADEGTLEARIRSRGTPLSTGDRRITRAEEAQRFTLLVPRLGTLGFPSRHLDTSTMPPHAVANAITNWIKERSG